MLYDIALVLLRDRRFSMPEIIGWRHHRKRRRNEAIVAFKKFMIKTVLIKPSERGTS